MLKEHNINIYKLERLEQAYYLRKILDNSVVYFYHLTTIIEDLIMELKGKTNNE